MSSFIPKNISMVSFKVNLNLLSNPDLKRVAELGFTKDERNKYCHNRCGKCFSACTKAVLIELIASKLTLYDLSYQDLIEIYKNCFPCFEVRYTLDPDAGKRFIIKHLALERSQALESLRNHNNNPDPETYFPKPYAVTANYDPWAIHNLAMFFMGFNGHGRQLEGIGADCALLEKFMKKRFPTGHFKKTLESRSTQSDELIRFNIRHFFERSNCDGMSHCCLVLSGHGDLKGNLDIGDNQSIQIKDILQQWHMHYQTFTSNCRYARGLILLCDYCNSGQAIDAVQQWECRYPCCANIVIQTACGTFQGSYDHFFVPSVLSLLSVSHDDAAQNSLPECDNRQLQLFTKTFSKTLNDRAKVLQHDGSKCVRCEGFVPAFTFTKHHCRICRGVVCRSCCVLKSQFGVLVCKDCEHSSELQEPQLYSRTPFQGVAISYLLIEDNTSLVFYSSPVYVTLWQSWVVGEVRPLFEALIVGVLKDPNVNSGTPLTVVSHVDLLARSDIKDIGTLNIGKDYRTECANKIQELVKAREKSRVKYAILSVSLRNEPTVQIAINVDNSSYSEAYYVKGLRGLANDRRDDNWYFDGRKDPTYSSASFNNVNLSNWSSDCNKLSKMIASGKHKHLDRIDRSIFDHTSMIVMESLRFPKIAELVGGVVEKGKRGKSYQNMTFPNELLQIWDKLCNMRTCSEIGLMHPSEPFDLDNNFASWPTRK